MKRVLIISYYWPPSGGAGVQRWLKFSKFLPDFGWEPVIITVDPEKATFPVLDHSLQDEIRNEITVIKTDSTEWFSIYKKVSGTENVPYAGFASESKKVSLKQKAARFIRGNFFLPDPRKGWNKHALEASKKVLDESEIDCIITTGPPHSSQLIGLELSKKYDIPWIADFRDPWTDIYYYKQFYPTRFANRINQKMEGLVLEAASAVITVSPSWKTMLENKITGNKHKVKVLTNGYDPDNFNPAPNTNKQLVITYLGTMSDIYPLDAFLKAFESVIRQHPGVLLRFIGTISEDQRKKIFKLPEENHEIIAYVNHQTAIEYLYSSSALLLIIPSHESSLGIVPGKMFEYLAAGRPILYLGPEESDGAEIIRQSNAGCAIDSSNESVIKDTVLDWVKDLPKPQPPEQYSRKNLTESLVRIMENLESAPNN